MLVKDEPAVLACAIRSALPFISSWLFVVDEGYTNGIQELVASELSGIPGRLVERPWVNHGHNRSEAMVLARDMADYSLVMDADDVLEPADGFVMPELSAEAYTLKVIDNTIQYPRRHLFRNDIPWRYEGAAHEYPTADRPIVGQWLEGLVYLRRQDDTREQAVAKYLKDAKVLEAALKVDPTNARNAFYLAQSYRDAGDFTSAIAAYRRRAEMGGWEQEVYYSYYNIGKLLELECGPPSEIVGAYMSAYDACPTRAEAMYELAAHYVCSSKSNLAYLFAREAAAIPLPKEALFSDLSVYAWRCDDILAVACYFTGRHHTTLFLIDRILASADCPDGERARLEYNRAMSVSKLV